MNLRYYFNPMSGVIEFLLYRRLPNGTRQVVKPINLEIITLENSESSEATFTLPEYEGRELLKDLAEELDKNGIKTSKDAKMEGTLEATRYHLEDMRKLIFKTTAPVK